MLLFFGCLEEFCFRAFLLFPATIPLKSRLFCIYLKFNRFGGGVLSTLLLRVLLDRDQLLERCREVFLIETPLFPPTMSLKSLFFLILLWFRRGGGGGGLGNGGAGGGDFSTLMFLDFDELLEFDCRNSRSLLDRFTSGETECLTTRTGDLSISTFLRLFVLFKQNRLFGMDNDL